MRALRWVETPLGDVATWPATLRTSLDLCLGSPVPMGLYWGAEQRLFFNDALLLELGDTLHLHHLGLPAFDELPELRALLEPRVARVLASGQALGPEEVSFPHHPSMSLSHSPVSDSTGAVVGVLCVVSETRQRGKAYRNVMQAPFPVAILRGADHVIELANPPILRAWGKGSEVVGMPLLEAMPALVGQPFRGYLDEVFRTGVGYEGHEELARLQRGDKSELDDVYFNFTYAALRDADDAIEGILITAFEVTEAVVARKRVEHALDEARQERERAAWLAAHLSTTAERLHSAQEAANIGVFDWRMDSNELTWSPQMYRLMGLAPGSIRATPEAWTEALAEEDRERAWQAYERVVDVQGEMVEVELRLLQPDGGMRWIRLSTQVEYDSIGVPRRVLGAVVDIQGLKQAETAHRMALDEAQRASQARDELLTTMTEELRTPLQAMLSWVTQLRHDHDDRAQLERGLSVLERSAQDQSKLVTDLLDAASIIGGKLHLNRSLSDASSVILAAVEAERPAAEAKGVSLSAELDPDLGEVLADPERLRQIVSSLLGNAVKLTPPGGQVNVEADRLRSTLILSVEDGGPGIASADLSSFFERRSPGALSLTVVRRLTEAHGGTVSVNSAGLGHGATFTVSLPLTSAPG